MLSFEKGRYLRPSSTIGVYALMHHCQAQAERHLGTRRSIFKTSKFAAILLAFEPMYSWSYH